MKRTAESILDELLVIRAQAGDRASLESLVKRHHSRLLKLAYMRVANTDAALEIVQESWVSVVKGLGRLKDPARFAAWVDQMVRHKSVDWLRRHQKHQRHATTVDPQTSLISNKESTAEDICSREEHLQSMRRALRSLPDSQRRLLSLFYLDGYSVKEIASLLNIAVGTVKSRLFNARAALRDAVEGGCEQRTSELSPLESLQSDVGTKQ